MIEQDAASGLDYRERGDRPYRGSRWTIRIALAGLFLGMVYPMIFVFGMLRVDSP